MHSSHYFKWKRWFDRIGAFLLLIPALPIIGMCIVLIRLTSPGAAIYRQVRVGKGGSKYLMYKLRTMHDQAERHTGPMWTMDDRDPRITFIGRILRRCQLDELPQLFNVLKGDMSLVGPRPERPEFVRVLKQQVPGYAERLTVLPGITGLAQVNLPADANLDSVRRKLVLDLDYIQHANFWLDVRMIVVSFFSVLGVRRPAVRLLGLHRMVALPEEELSRGNGHAQLTPDQLEPASLLPTQTLDL